MSRKSLLDNALISGDERARTVNPRLAKPVLSQLSYVPPQNKKTETRIPKSGGQAAFAGKFALDCEIRVSDRILT